MSTPLRILACQIVVPPIRAAVERDAHVRAIADRICAELKTQAVDLVVLPELSSIEYSREAFDALDALAEPLNGPTTKTFSKLAIRHNVTIVFGIARRDGDKTYISQVVVGPEGQIFGHFDKLHRAEFGLSEEKDFFTPGDHVLTFDCGAHRVAPIICYDIRFPELARMLTVQHGVQLILHCGAYGRDPSFDTWHAFVTARAVENQIYVLSLNRAGALFGDSVFCGPWIDQEHPLTHFPAHDEAFKFLEIDPQQLRDARKTYTFLDDRFDDYAHLPHRHGGNSL